MNILNLLKRKKERRIEDMVFCGRCKYHLESEMIVGYIHRCTCPKLQEMPYCDITPIRAKSEQLPTYCGDVNKNNDCTFYEEED